MNETATFISGKSFGSHPVDEYFFADGEWRARISSRGPIFLNGSWEVGPADGDLVQVCVIIDENAESQALSGKSKCRSIRVSRERQEVEISSLLNDEIVLTQKLITIKDGD